MSMVEVSWVALEAPPFAATPVVEVSWASLEAPPMAVAPPVPAVKVMISFAVDPFAPVWTDVTHRVISFRTRRGRQEELGRFEPGRATIVLADEARPGETARRFDPFNPTSPYAGNLTERRPVRIQMDIDGARSNLWTGYSERWLPSTTTQETVLEASDALEFLAGRRLAGSAWDLGARSPLPVTQPAPGAPLLQAYYRLGVTPGTRSVKNEYFPADAPGTIIDAEATRLPFPDRVPDMALAGFNGTTTRAVLPSKLFGASGAWMFAAVVRCTPSTAFQYLAYMGVPGSLLYGLFVYIQPSTGGNPGAAAASIQGSSGGAAVGRTLVGPARRVDDGEPHLVIVSHHNFNNTSYLYVQTDDEVRSSTASSNVDFLIHRETMHIGQHANGTERLAGHIGDVLMWFGSDYPHLSLRGALRDGSTWYPPALGGGMTPRARIQAISDLAGWPAAQASYDTTGLSGNTMTQLPDFDRSRLDLFRDAADAEGGAFYADRAGLLRFRSAGNLPAVTSATFGPADLAYDDVELEQLPVINTVTTTPPGRSPRTSVDAASVARYSTRDHDLPLEVELDATVDARQAAVLAARATPATRIRSLSIAPLSTTAVANHVAQAELEQKVRVIYTPVGGGYTLDRTTRIAGWEDDYTDRRWRRRYYLEGDA